VEQKRLGKYRNGAPTSKSFRRSSIETEEEKEKTGKGVKTTVI